MTCDLRQYAAAIAVIRATLGQKWINKRLGTTAGDSYVRRTDGIDGPRSYYHQDRVTDLGELLFNMQTVPGFESQLRKLRANSLESAIVELQGARFIHSTGVQYRFVTETGTKGRDFDVAIAFGDIEVACEVKTRMDGTSPSAKSVHSRLSEARKQLPRSAPGMIFMKIPQSWLSEPHCQVALENGVARLFRGTQRVAGVFVLWEEWVDHPPGAIRFTRFHHWQNPHARIDAGPLLRDIVDTAGSVDRRWAELWAIVCNQQDRTRRTTLGLGFRIEQWVRSQEQSPPRGVFPSAIYRGSLDDLRSYDPAKVRTTVQFRCPQFPIFMHASGSENSAAATVSTGEVRSFTILRNASEQTFVICVSHLMHDEELRTINRAAIAPPINRIRRATALLNQGVSPHELDDGDVLIDSVRRLFAAMRADGDLPSEMLGITDVRASYFLGESQEPVFQVDYPGRQFMV